MAGRPVWLVSLSQRTKRDAIIETSRWGQGTINRALDVARRVLGPLGDPSHGERGFMMMATFCLHRAASDTEISALPPGPGGLAGPPFAEVVYESDGCPPIGLSFTPCDRRRFQHVTRPRRGQQLRPQVMRIPIDDCGDCDSCRARAAHLQTKEVTA